MAHSFYISEGVCDPPCQNGGFCSKDDNGNPKCICKLIWGDSMIWTTGTMDGITGEYCERGEHGEKSLYKLN